MVEEQKGYHTNCDIQFHTKKRGWVVSNESRLRGESGSGVRMSCGVRAKSFLDLDVYKRLYLAMVRVAKEVTPKLPAFERDDLADQMRRASKAPIAIIAEGYARKSYQKDWLRYINEAMGECNEMIVHLSICRDIYGEKFDKKNLESLISEYDICGKQLYRLGQSWQKRDGGVS